MKPRHDLLPRVSGPVSILIIAFIFLGHLSTLQSARASTPKYGGTLIFVGEVEAMGFDAIKARNLFGTARMVSGLVMERLFDRGPGDQLIPKLGLSATPTEGGKVWVIKLRQGVEFHDGTPFNADAVVHHWQRLLNPENRFRERLLLKPIQSVEKTADDEVRFILKHPWLPFLSCLTDPARFPGFIPSPKAVRDDTHNRAPVGTGPFVFKEWKSGDRIRVIKNPNYWRKDRPYLDEVVCRPIPDHQSRYGTLISGQANVMITDRPAHVKKLAANPDFNTYPLNWRGAGILTLNTTKAPLNDIRVRRALAMAWDQKQYIRTSFQDIMPYTEHWFGDGIDCNDTHAHTLNIEKAKTLIAEYGKPVELEYAHTASNRGHQAGVILQQMFKKIDVKINPTPLDFPGIMKKLISKNFDITSWLIPGAHDMGPITTAIVSSKSPWNVTGYANETVDKLLMEQRLSTDPEKRSEMFCNITRTVNSDVPFLYLFGRTYYVFARKNIMGIKLSVSGEEAVLISDVWIDE
jgi:4-phytase/acid phosphatase/peptide/nickel transport system substrate-binding protein